MAPRRNPLRSNAKGAGPAPRVPLHLRRPPTPRSSGVARSRPTVPRIRVEALDRLQQEKINQQNDSPSQVSRAVKNLLLVYDVGQGYTKCGYACYDDIAIAVDLTLQRLGMITMPNGATEMDTKVAFGNDGKLIWGQKLDDAIVAYEQEKSGVKPTVTPIDPASVLYGFKRAIFDPERYPVKILDALTTRILDEKKNTTKRNEKHRTVDCAEAELDLNRPEISLLIEFLRELHSYCLEEIQRHGVSIDENTNIRVGFPLPVGTTMAQSYLIMAAAKKAGIPNPIEMTEPAAALLFHLKTQQGALHPGDTILNVDHGTFSIDFQLWTIAGLGPLQVKETADSESLYCGGDTVNDRAWFRLKKRIEENYGMDTLLDDLAKAGNPMTEAEFKFNFKQKFEKEKKSFNGRQGRFIEIMGLPDLPNLGMMGRSKLWWDEKDFKEDFDRNFNDIITTIERMLARIKHPVTVIMSGGGFHSPYLRERITGYFEDKLSPTGYQVQVNQTRDDCHMSCGVAKGGLLWLAEENLITEKRLRRGFSIVGNEEVPHITAHPIRLRIPGPDGISRIAYLLNLIPAAIGLKLPYTVSARGYRLLHKKDLVDTPEGKAWPIYEALFNCDKSVQDHKRVDDERYNGLFYEMRNPIQFHILEQAAKHFVRKQGTTKDAPWHVEYEVEITLAARDLLFKIIIPQSGVFRLGEVEKGYGKNPMIQHFKYDATGVFTSVNIK